MKNPFYISGEPYAGIDADPTGMLQSMGFGVGDGELIQMIKTLFMHKQV